MESPGNSNGQRTVSGSPGRAEQGVAGIPPGMETQTSNKEFPTRIFDFRPMGELVESKTSSGVLQSTAFVAATV